MTAAATMAMTTMMSRRRSSSRCSMRLIVGPSSITDASSAGRRLPHRPGGGSGLGLVVRGRRLGGRGRLAWLSANRALEVVRRLAELLDAATDGIADVGQLARAEDDQHDHEKDDELRPTDGSHVLGDSS